jgi:hypothetical protein
MTAAPSARALDACKLAVDKKDGTLLLRAKDVSGTLRWGYDAQGVVGVFDNANTCLVGTTARGCTLGGPDTAERVTPPPLCTVHLADDSGTCTAFVKGCTPGARTTCPPDMERIGAWCIDREGMSPAVEFGEAAAACAARGRSLCPLEALLECDTTRDGASFPAQSCAGYTDGQGGDWLWTITPHAADGVNFFAVMTVYQGDNVAQVQSTTIGSEYSAFCCQRVAGP